MKKNSTSSSILLICVIVLSACNMPVTTPAPTPAADVNDAFTLQVNTFADTYDGFCSESDCSLRDAVMAANEKSNSTIILPAGLYRLTREPNEDDSGLYGDLDIHSNITIIGAGIDNTNITGGNLDRIFHVAPDAQLDIREMSLIAGVADDSVWTITYSYADCLGNWFKQLPGVNWFFDEDFGEDGPVINCELTSGSDLSDKYPGFERRVDEKGGGAIANRGHLKLTNVSVVFSSGKQGGGIRNKRGVVEMNGGFICENSAELGGGVYNYNGQIILKNMGVCKNSASFAGSAVYTQGGDMEVINVTFGENIGGESGRAKKIWTFESDYSNSGGTEVYMLNVTFYKNTSAAIYSYENPISLRNTLLADNGGKNCIGEVLSLGNNMEDQDTCRLTQASDHTFTEVNLDDSPSSLGGFYQLLADSPAIDGGDNANCPSVDQQGEARMSGLGCDIGADEFQSSVDVSIAPPSDTVQPVVTQPAAVAPTSVPPTNPAPTQAPAIEEPPTPTLLPPTQLPPTLTLTPVPDSQTASISGKVWNDANGDGTLQNGETPLALQTVQLGIGPCNSSGLASMDTNLAGGYTFNGLAAGTYCVSVERAESCGNVTSATTPKQVTVALSPGQALSVSFGFQKAIC